MDVFDLQNTWYISDIWDSVDTTQWSSILGTNIVWWDKSDWYENISIADIIQIWINKTWQLFEFELNTEWWDNGIFFGGIYVYYNAMNSKNKAFSNII